MYFRKLISNEQTAFDKFCMFRFEQGFRICYTIDYLYKRRKKQTNMINKLFSVDFE